MPLHSHHLPQQEISTDKIIVSVEFDTNGECIDIVYAPFGYHELVVKVQKETAMLCSVHREDDPDFPDEPLYTLISLNPPLSAKEALQLHTWLMANVEATGGTLAIPGFYAITLPLPDWLKAKLR